jgi:hypothetical protein
LLQSSADAGSAGVGLFRQFAFHQSVAWLHAQLQDRLP